MKNLSFVFLFLIALVGLSGCNSDDKSNENVVLNNLHLHSIEVDNSKTYHPGDPLDIAYSIEKVGLEDMESVDVQFYLVHKTEVSDSGESAEDVEEAHHIGHIEHDNLQEGQNRFYDHFVMPVDLAENGEYMVITIIDPDNLIEEDNELDNHPNIDNEQHIEGNFPFAELTVEGLSDHDFHIDKVELSQSALILDAPGVDGHGSHNSDILGFIDATYFGKGEGIANLHADILVDGDWQALQLWNATSNTYEVDHEIDFAYDNYDHHFGFDIRIPESIHQSLYDFYEPEQENTFTLRLSLSDPHDVIEEHNHNNTVELEVPYYFFGGVDEQPVAMSAAASTSNALTNLSFEKSYNKEYGDSSKFQIGLDLYGLAKLDLALRGGVIKASGGVSATIFNAENDLFAIDYVGSAYVSGLNTGYSSSMMIFNNVVFEDENYTAQFEKSWEQSWEQERTLVSATFTIGPIPLKVEAGVTGSLGFGLTIGYLAELYAEGDLVSVNFSAYARGGVNLGFASAGIQAELTLIDNVFSLESSVDLTLASNESATPQINYAIDLNNDLDVISGKFGLYAEVYGIKWCKKWGIPYPCGRKTTRYDLWLYQTPSVFNKTWTIYSAEGTVDL